MFLVAFSAFTFGLLICVQDIVKEFPIFRRERMVNLGILPYVLSKFALLAPLLTLLLVLMVGVLRLTGRLPASGLDVYWKLIVTVALTGFAGLALALLTSALVRSSQQATDMLSFWIMPQVLFAGALLAVPAMTVVGRTIAALAPVRWSFEALGKVVDLDHQFQVDTSQIGAGLTVSYGDSFTRDLGESWAILAAFVVVPLGLTCLALKRRTTMRPIAAAAPAAAAPAPAAAPRRPTAPPPQARPTRAVPAEVPPEGPREELGLAIVEGPGVGRRFPVAHTVLAGRDSGADMVLEDPEVSARHASFAPANGGLSVEDLDSTNGTFVNGQRLSGQQDVRSGDRVRVGTTVLEVIGHRETRPAPRRRGAPSRR